MTCQQITFLDYLTGSRDSLGGTPLLPAGQAWPECEHCRTPMSFFLQFDVASEWETGLVPGSHLSLFMCLKHDDPVMPPLQPEIQGQLPERYWELTAEARQYSQFLLQLAPAGTGLQPQDVRPGVLPQTLSFTPHSEEITDTGRLKLGEALFKIGGMPSWFQEPETYTCCCGAAMDFLCEIPKDYEFPKQPQAPAQENSYSDSHYSFFLGNEVYIFACRAQCHPQALWPISQ
ncbi:MAG: DUF1963 domain-containing protein [Candidatus Sericytochromatia bacterium]